jgi:hypothetical protein
MVWGRTTAADRGRGWPACSRIAAGYPWGRRPVKRHELNMTSEHRAACTTEIEEFVNFYIHVDGAELPSLDRLDNADLILLTAAIEKWKKSICAIKGRTQH